MQKHIEDEIVAGKAIALVDMRECRIPVAALEAGILVYANVEPGRSKLSWTNPEAKKANDATIQKLLEGSM